MTQSSRELDVHMRCGLSPRSATICSWFDRSKQRLVLCHGTPAARSHHQKDTSPHGSAEWGPDLHWDKNNLWAVPGRGRTLFTDSYPGETCAWNLFLCVSKSVVIWANVVTAITAQHRTRQKDNISVGMHRSNIRIQVHMGPDVDRSSIR